MTGTLLGLLILLSAPAAAYDNEGGAPSLSTAATTAPAASTAAPSAAPFAAVVPAEAGASGPAPSAAPRLSFGTALILGSRSYVGSSTLFEASASSWNARVGYREYSQGASTGTFNTFSGRLGWTDGSLAAGLVGEFTPRDEGYRSRAFGGDLGWSWRPAGKSGLVRRVSLLGSLERFSHSTDLPAARNQPVVSSDIGQTDLSASASVTVRGAAFSAGVKKSVYNQAGSDLLQSTSRVLLLANFDAVVSGFPQDEWWLRASLENVGWGISPSVSWTRTVYKSAQAPSVAAQAGLTRAFKDWSASAFYGRLSERGQSDRGYFGLGASVRF